MPTSQTLLAFTLVSTVVMVVPGPSSFFLLAHGIGHARRSALAPMGGIETASAIRVVLAAAGLTAVLATSAVALNLVRWGGVAYLAYLVLRGVPVPDSPAPARATRAHATVQLAPR